jgi:hypothetical protein
MIRSIQTTGTNRGQQFHIAALNGGVFGKQPPLDVCFDEEDNIVVLRPTIQKPALSEFTKHKKKWNRDTQYTSSLSEKFLHPSYARIIGLGWPVVPMILASLKREPDDWFYALRAITGADPVRMGHAGIMPKMTDAWLNWGRRHGLI